MNITIKDNQHLNNLAQVIKSKNIFQKKIVEKLLSNGDEQYLNFAESVVSRIIKVVDRNESYDYLADTYLWYTKLLRIEEILGSNAKYSGRAIFKD